VDYCHRPNSVV